MHRTHSCRGLTFITCLIFLVVFLALGASLATMSGANVQLSANQRRASRALAGAESGLEVMRYWLGHVMMDATTPPADYLQKIINQVKLELQNKSATNMKLASDGVLQAVSIDSAVGQNFSAQLAMNTANPSILDVTVTGTCEGMERTICVGYNIAPYEHPIFKYGLATKGPIQFSNNPTTTTVTSNWEADIYTESSSSMVAVEVGGNTNFAGDISIANPSAVVDFAGAVQIGGDTGQDAIDNHVSIGVDPVEFPAVSSRMPRDLWSIPLRWTSPRA